MTVVPRCTLDGRPVDAVPSAFALHGYGVFTTFVADAGAVLGWPLHLARLVDGAEALWGHRVDREQVGDVVRAHLRDEPGPASVRVTLFPEHLSVATPEDAAGARILITSTPTVVPEQPTPDLRVQTVVHQRPLWEMKTTTLLPLVALRRAARLAGHDDALLCAGGHLLEGTTWNVLVWRDGEVATPEAGVLPGSTVTHLAEVADGLGHRLVRRPVLHSELDTADLVLAVSVNHPARAITRVDDRALPVDRGLQADIAAGYAALPRRPV